MNKETALLTLDDCRRRIDDLDLRILALLNERTLAVEQIGRAKQSLDLPIYEPRREDEVYANVTGHNSGPLPATTTFLPAIGRPRTRITFWMS